MRHKKTTAHKTAEGSFVSSLDNLDELKSALRLDELRSLIQKNPWLAVGLASGVGFLWGAALVTGLPRVLAIQGAKNFVEKNVLTHLQSTSLSAMALKALMGGINEFSHSRSAKGGSESVSTTATHLHAFGSETPQA